MQYDAQLAYFTRYNSVNFKPDTLGDIVFNGIASNVFRGAFVNGVQGDAAYRLNELHTLRAGFISSGETTNVNSTNGVLGMDPDTGATSANPFTIIDPVSKVGWIAGFYLQDEWKLTDQLTLNYGFRFDQMWQFVNTNQLSPRVNMIYTPWDGSQDPRRLRPLFHAAGAGARRPDQHLGVRQHDQSARCAAEQSGIAGAIARVRRRCDTTVRWFSDRP